MKKSIKPITPQEINSDIEGTIPNFVIEAINNLLKKNYRNGSCILLQKDIVAEVLDIANDKGNNIIKDDIYKNKWMNFEQVFEKFGWNVIYDKPGFNENFYEPTFEFKPKRKYDPDSNKPGRD